MIFIMTKMKCTNKDRYIDTPTYILLIKQDKHNYFLPGDDDKQSGTDSALNKI